jgi:long-chain acyl-CoA synthetase
MEKQFSIPYIPSDGSDEGIRRSIISPHELISTPDKDVKTLYDVLQYSAKTYGPKNAMGTRKIEKIIEEEKEVTKIVNGEEIKEMKKWKYFKLSGYKWLNYEEIVKETRDIGSGLVKLGLKKDDKVTIFASTRYI